MKSHNCIRYSELSVQTHILLNKLSPYKRIEFGGIVLDDLFTVEQAISGIALVELSPVEIPLLIRKDPVYYCKKVTPERLLQRLLDKEEKSI